MTVFPFPPSSNSTPDWPASDLICRYWASLPRQGLAPDRMALDASAIAPALPHLFIAELVTPRVARLRVVGHKLEDLSGLDMRGMPLSVLFQAAARAELATACAQVSHGARVLLPLVAERGWGQPALSGQLTLLPLSDGPHGITRVLGVLEHQGKIGHTPRRFGIAAGTQVARDMPAPAPKAPALRVIMGGKV